MLLVYVDESENKRMFWLGALICPGDVIRHLTEELDELSRKTCASYKFSDYPEFHGYPLFCQREVWKALTPDQVVDLYCQVLDTIASYEVEVIIRGVVRKRLQLTTPYSALLPYLLERVDERASSYGQPALVIADHVPDADSDYYRHQLRYFQRWSTQGYKPRKLQNVVDTLYFAPSDASRLVQAIDMVMYMFQRWEAKKHPNDLVKDAVEKIWGQIEGRVTWDFWTPQPIK